MSTDIPKPSRSLDDLANPADTPAPDRPADTSAQAEDSQDFRERARDVQERLEGGFHEMEQRYDEARGQLRDFNDRAVEFIRENPAACMAGGVCVGYLLGKLASRRWLS